MNRLITFSFLLLALKSYSQQYNTTYLDANGNVIMESRTRPVNNGTGDASILGTSTFDPIQWAKNQRKQEEAKKETKDVIINETEKPPKDDDTRMKTQTVINKNKKYYNANKMTYSISNIDTKEIVREFVVGVDVKIVKDTIFNSYDITFTDEKGIRQGMFFSYLGNGYWKDQFGDTQILIFDLLEDPSVPTFWISFNSDDLAVTITF